MKCVTALQLLIFELFTAKICSVVHRKRELLRDFRRKKNRHAFELQLNFQWWNSIFNTLCWVGRLLNCTSTGFLLALYAFTTCKWRINHNRFTCSNVGQCDSHRVKTNTYRRKKEERNRNWIQLTFLIINAKWKMNGC